MPRRGDNIRKRKDGRWEARYIRQDGDKVPPKYCSVYGRSYQEAKKKRDEIMKQEKPQASKNPTVVFRDVLNVWQESNKIRLKESSVSRYQNLIETHILPELGNKRMDQLTTSVINCHLTSMLKNGRLDNNGGLSAAYVRSIALIINSAIAFGATADLCRPLKASISKPPVPKQELTILSTESQTVLECGLLENMCAEKLLIYITLYTGLRIGEACALRWEDIDLDRKLLYVKQTLSRVWYVENGKKKSKWIIDSPKTPSSQRYIPICSKLYAVLCSFPHAAKQGYILTDTKTTGFLSPRTFEYRYKSILKKCGLEVFNYHALRHTFATRCIERGVDIKSLSEILGHSDVAITLNTYVHSSMDLKRLQLEKLAS